MTPSSSSTRKSERLEKRTPAPPIHRKVEEQKTPSPLRRSERGKKQSPSSSSGSKKSTKSLGSSPNKKLRKEKSVEKLIVETKEVNKSETKMEKNRLSARAYRSLFNQQQKKVNVSDGGKVRNKQNELHQECSSGVKGGSSKNVDGKNEYGQGKVEKPRESHPGRDLKQTLEESNCRVSEPANELAENNIGHEFSISSQNHKLVEDTHQSVDVGCKNDFRGGDGVVLSSHETMSKKQDDVTEIEKQNLPPESVTSVLKKGVPDGGGELKSGFEDVSSKRKRNTIDMDFDSSPTGNNFAESYATSFKRQRVNHDLCNTKLNQVISGASLPEDTGETGGGVTTGLTEPCITHLQHKESSINQNICIICKLGGMLLCCEGRGCKSSYHLSCLDPPLKDVPLGVWYCLTCVRKKIKSGVYSVSEGVESIWDVKEVVSDDSGLPSKQYLVKYKGLAYVHNRWVPESQLLVEAPLLVAKFNKKNQTVKWKPEWTEPHRLLQKRLLECSKQHDEVQEGYTNDDLDCRYEWLVKWHGLGYEHATWELENASFMELPSVQSLMREYENRHEKAKRGHCLSGTDKKFEIKQALLAGGLTGIDNNHLDFTHNLLERWQNGQNVVLIDDQERVTKMIEFISSLSSFVSRPFLVITTSAVLSLWDEEFFHFTPSPDVVFYHGDKDLRRSIRAVEFYEGEGIMFKVLVTSPEVVTEDLSALQLIKWEAIIVDEYQRCRVYSHLEQIKGLNTDMRILLFNGQIKDGCIEHLLSLVDCQSDMISDDRLLNKSSPKIANLKERLSKYVVNSSKSDSDYSRFVEYWVPVQISKLQLEQYCDTLLSNSLLLGSSSKNDLVGAFSDILISTRKCCDHPYIIAQPQDATLPKDAKELLDIGVKASGKLQLLEAMLFEIRKRGLRVIVLFQSSGAGKDKIGDILDDFVRQRFGQDSYERIDGFVNPRRKQAALNNFNNEKTRFVFLLETCACLPSIKLSSVDAVIIFGSDWSPANDLRNLQKIKLDPQFERLNIFRLFSSFTVEENVLILGKQDKTLDSNVKNISRATGQSLLMPGASYLFSKLDEYHKCCTPTSSGSFSCDQLPIKEVIQDFQTILSQNAKDNNSSSSSVILKAKQNQGTYVSDSPLPGEQKIHLIDEELPHIFWKKLLNGRRGLNLSSGLPQRIRKRPQASEDIFKKAEDEGEEVSKKRKKIGNNDIRPKSSKYALLEENIAAGQNEGSVRDPSLNVQQLMFGSTHHSHANHASSSPSLTNKISEPAVNTAKSSQRINLHDSQKSLHLHLKPEIGKLCDILQLPENVKVTTQSFLEYVMNNHSVSREPATILQAFQISLCWTAASLLKHKLDHKKSLDLAKQHLNFGCKKEEADYVYSVLRCLKKVFVYHTGNDTLACSSEISKSPTQVNKDYLQARSDQALLQLGLAQQDYSKSIKDIEKKCGKQMRKLSQKQQEEITEFNKKYSEEKAQLEIKQRTEAAVIRLHSSSSMRADKLKLLDIEYKKNFEALEQRMKIQCKSMEEMHVEARNKLEKKKASWLEGVKAWAKEELINKPSSKETGYSSLNPHLKNQKPEVVQSRQDREVSPEVPETASSNDNGRNLLPGSPSKQIPDGVKSDMICEDALVRVSSLKSLNNGSEVNVSSPEKQSPNAEDTLRDNVHALPLDNAAEVDQQDVICIINQDPSVDQLNGMVSSRVIESPLNVVVDNLDKQQDGGFLVHQATNNDSSDGSAGCGQHDAEAPSGRPESAPNEVVETGETSKRQDETIQVVESVHNQESQFLGSTAVLSQQETELPSGVIETVIAEGVEGHCSDKERGVLQDECLLPMESAVMQDGVASTSLQQVDASVHQNDVIASIQENHDVSVPEHIEDQVGTSTQAVSQPVEHTMLHLSTGLPLGGSSTHVSDSRAPSGVNLQTVHNVPPVQVPPLPLCHDPLQIELERLRKETNQILNTHEDTKLRLKSDCEKEIEEAVAQIRGRYDLKSQELEAEFLKKKAELETNEQRVLMNKLLAEAFRSKCMDMKASTAPTMQQELSSSFMQQLLQLSLQTSQPPAIGPQLAVPSTRNASPSLQAVHLSPALYAGNAVRPPHISSISGNRAPAPHLQPFRPPSANPTTLSSLTVGIPSQQTPNIPATTSSISLQPSLRPPLITVQSHPLDIAHQPDTSNIFPIADNSSLPAVELLVNVDNQTNANPCSILHPQPDSGRNLNPAAPAGSLRPVHDTRTNVDCPNEVVCLSDDD